MQDDSPPVATPEPTDEPVPVADGWLEPDPGSVTFDGGEWRQFTLQATDLERINVLMNVWPTSTGAVEFSHSSQASPVDSCELTYYTAYPLPVDTTFHLVGCQPGTVYNQT